MSKSTNVKAVVLRKYTASKPIDLHAVTEQQAAVRIKAKKGLKIILTDEDTQFAPENITASRVGNDLHIALEGTPLDQAELVIENFFTTEEVYLIGQAEDGSYYNYIASNGEFSHFASELLEGDEAPLVLGGDPYTHEESSTNVLPLWFLLGGLAAAGAAYAAFHDDDDNDHYYPQGETPTFSEAIDDVGPIQGPISNGGITDDSTPTFKGVSQPGQIITIYDNGKVIGSTVADENGHWTFTPPPLGDGQHSVTVTGHQPGEVPSPPSPPFDFEVDTIPPDMPRIETIIDNIGSVTGPLNPGDETDDPAPVISGTGTPGHTIVIYTEDENGKRPIGSAVVGEDGRWEVHPDDPLKNGQNTLTAVEYDRAGNASDPTDPITIFVNAVAPEPPTIVSVHDDVELGIGYLQKGDTTNDNTPTIRGTGEPGSIINIYSNNKLIGSTVVKADKTWEFTPTESQKLDDGKHNLTATATSKAGIESDHTGIWDFTVKTSKPNPVTELEVVDNVGDVTGPLKGGDTTDDSRPVFNGKADPGDTVIIKDNDKIIGSTVADGSGNWTYKPGTALGDGDHSLVVEVTDPAGNTSNPVGPINVVVDTSNIPVQITDIVDNVQQGVGPIEDNALINDPAPVINGKGKDGSIITIKDGGTVLGSVTVENGVWTFKPNTPLSNGNHSITAEAREPSGNIYTTPPFDFVVEVGTPTKPTIEGIEDDVGSIVGNIINGGYTDDTTPTLTGTAKPNSIVTIYNGSTEMGKVQANEHGHWSFTPTTELPEATYNFTVVAVDPAGNTSDRSDPYTVHVDVKEPNPPQITGLQDNVGDNAGANIPSGGSTDDSKPIISGQGGTPGHTIIIYAKDPLVTDQPGYVIGSTVVNADGSWSLQPDVPLANGLNTLSAVERDFAGNVSKPSTDYGVRIDIAGPNPPTIISVYDDVEDHVGYIQKGDATNDPRPTFTGSATAGSIVTIYDNGVIIGSVKANDHGLWRFTPDTNLSESSHDITVTSRASLTDPEDPHSGKWNFTVDITRPDNVTDLVILDDVGLETGPLHTNDTTDDNRPTFSGKAEPGSVVTIYDGVTPICSTQVDGSGNWSVTPSQPLPDGRHDLTTTVTDAAGNTSVPGSPIVITVDTSATPPVSIDRVVDDKEPVLGNIQPGTATNDTTPEIIGKGNPGSVITIYDNGQPVASTTVKPNGTWSVTPTLDEGHHDITAVTDGDRATETPPFHIEVDLTPPEQPTIGSIVDDVGSVTGRIEPGSNTDDTTPTLTGSGSEPGSVITVKDGDKVVGSVIVDSSGNWSFTPTTSLPEGSHSFTVTETDPAGNTSPPSNPYEVVVKLVPDVPTIVGMTKDTDVDGDFVTSDGSAGRGVFGTIPRPLEANETVQISVDGGRTWLDADATGTNWYAVDPNVHTGNWTIQARIVTSGAPGEEVSQNVTLTTNETRSAPTIVSIPDANGAYDDNSALNGSDVVIGLPADAKAGDLVHVIWGNTTYDQILTNADIAQGNVTVNVPPQCTQAQGSEKGFQVTAQISSPHGVISDMADPMDVYVRNPNRFADDLEDMMGKGTALGGTGNYELDSNTYHTGHFNLTLTSTDGTARNIRYSELTPNKQQYGKVPNVEGVNLAIPLDTQLTMDLDGPASSISFGILSIDQEITVSIFDIDGNLIKREVLNYNNTGDGRLDDAWAGDGSIAIALCGTYNFQCGPTDLPIGKVVIDVPANERGGIWLDYLTYQADNNSDLSLGRYVFDQSIDHAWEKFLGSANDDVVSISLDDPTQYLTSAGAGIHGGEGVDTLVLNGANSQILDLRGVAGFSLGGSSGNISSIEIMDITGIGNGAQTTANTLKIGLNEVLSLGQTNLFHDNNTVQMMIKGDNNDNVELYGANGTTLDDWTLTGNIDIGNTTYQIYQHSSLGAELLIQEGVNIIL